nr:hypothetical protein [Tanacetum cinerariifolium]
AVGQRRGRRVAVVVDRILWVSAVGDAVCGDEDDVAVVIAAAVAAGWCDFSMDDDLPSPDNEDKVFNPGILIREKSVKIITRVSQEKKLAISYASLELEDIDPPFYELLVFKEVPNLMRLLPFSSENEEKVFKLGIYTSEKNKKNTPPLDVLLFHFYPP